mgnify:CR=1 FL=1
MNHLEKNKGDLESSKLSELTNDELRDKILDINKEQLSKVGKMSYYYCISESGKLIQLVKKDSFLQKINSTEEKELLTKDFDYIIKSFKRFNVDMTNDEIGEEIQKLLDVRRELYNLSNAIEGYEIELSYIKELLDYNIMKKVGKDKYRDYELNSKEITILINKIGQILAQSTKDHYAFVNIVSNILSIMPFRMSKSKYFDVVKTTLIRNLKYYPKSIVESQIEDYKMFFDSSLNGNYGITFDIYFTKIQRFKNILVKNKSIDELEDINKDIMELKLSISKIGIFINSLGLLVNRLIVIYMTKDRFVLNSNMKEAFLLWKKYKEEVDKNLLESLIELSNEGLSKVEKQLLNDIKSFEDFNEEGLKRTGFFDDKLNQEMISTRKVLTYYNDIKFVKEQLLFPQNSEIIAHDYLEQLVDSLIQYINRSISQMDNLERKIRMKRLLSILELPFINIEEFLSYIKYSLDERIVSKEEVLFTIDSVNYWLNGLKEGQ